eukprot:192875-Chlamydomonas_euryale.AAC.2
MAHGLQQGKGGEGSGTGGMALDLQQGHKPWCARPCRAFSDLANVNSAIGCALAVRCAVMNCKRGFCRWLLLGAATDVWTSAVQCESSRSPHCRTPP